MLSLFFYQVLNPREPLPTISLYMKKTPESTPPQLSPPIPCDSSQTLNEAKHSVNLHLGLVSNSFETDEKDPEPLPLGLQKVGSSLNSSGSQGSTVSPSESADTTLQCDSSGAATPNVASPACQHQKAEILVKTNWQMYRLIKSC